jgi:hypothetical protein
MSKWFATNRLALNLDKTNIIKFIEYNSPWHALNIAYDCKCIEESVNMKFLGLQIDNHLNWTNHINKLIPKLSGACYAVRSKLKYGVIFRVTHLTARRYSLYKRKL